MKEKHFTVMTLMNRDCWDEREPE